MTASSTPGYVSNADLAARLSTLIDQWNNYKNELGNILTQPTGNVTMTDGLGNTVTMPSFPQLQKNVNDMTDSLTGAVSQAQDLNSQAAASATAASNSEDAAEAAKEAATAAQAAAKDSEDSASSYASAASGSASAASESASKADASASSSASSAEDAKESADAASDSAASSASDSDDSYSYANDAAVSADLAQKWASADTGVVVDDGKFSAYHWAMQAQATVTGLLDYRGSWDASTGSYPASPNKGFFFKVSGSGTVGGTDYAVGDQIIYNGAGWDKIDNTETVTAVAGKVGDVSLDVGDITGLQDQLDSKVASSSQPTFEGLLIANGGVNGGYLKTTTNGDGGFQSLVIAPASSDASSWDWGSQLAFRNGTRDWNFACKLHIQGYEVWHSGNFDPNSKADLSGGAYFSGDVSATGEIKTNRHLKVESGGSSVTFGYQANMSVNGGPYYSIWHAGNFNPNDKASLSGSTYAPADSLVVNNYAMKFDAFNGSGDYYIHGPDGPGDNIVRIRRNGDSNYVWNVEAISSTGGIVVSTEPNGIRQKNGDHGVFWRLNGDSFYLMSTALGDPDGTWNRDRALQWTFSSRTMYSNLDWVISGSFRALKVTDSSDSRLKEAVTDLESGLETIRQLRPVRYTFTRNGSKEIGFIADEVEKVLPETVEWDSDDEFGSIRSLAYARLTAPIVAAIKELDERIASLEKLYGTSK